MEIHIIPEAESLSFSGRRVFKLTRLCEFSSQKGTGKASDELIEFISDKFGLELLGTGKEKISLIIDETLSVPESYTLDITENHIEIKGADEEGAFYGVQTLKQIFHQFEENLPEIHISDKPQYPYRGFMLDCGRYFFPKEDVKKLIDIMALHKLNRFHWHLTDDQGWRAQLLDNILLTEIGAYRSHTNLGKTPHGGFYTKEDMKEIVEYAHKKCIKVIPEIDTPGHTVSAIAAYPFLSCFERDLNVATSFGAKHDILCAGKESTYEFMFSVFDELLEVFTDGIIHIGGGDVPTAQWESCPNCQKKIRDEGLENTDGLLNYYLSRIARHIEEKGSKTVMWNDTAEAHTEKCSFISQVKEDTELVVSAENAYRLDLPYSIINLQQCYDYNPNSAEKLSGVEACLWTEFVPHMKKAGYQMFPRLGAFSETAWTKKENKSFERFYKKLSFYEYLISFSGMNYAERKQSMPKGAKKLASDFNWKRKQLFGRDFYNFIDNTSAERKHKGEENND